MGIKEAIAEFKKAETSPERFDVTMLGHVVGTATEWGYIETEDGCEMVVYYNFYPRSPTGIFPIGNIVVDWDDGYVYISGEKGGLTEIDYDSGVNIIEAIAKEL